MYNLSRLFKGFQQLFYGIGYFAEYIAFIVVIILLYYKTNYLIFFVILYFINRLLNDNIKNIIRGKRPDNPIKYLDIDQFGKTKFGMPSGHSQLTFFSIIFAYLILQKINGLLLFLLFTGIMSIIQRYIYRNHTLLQLFSGALFGGFIAYISIIIINNVKLHI